MKKPGELTFTLCSKYLDEIVTVDDDEIAQAILFLMERGKMVAEGAGAAPVAAIMNHKFDVSGKVVAVISGGNIDVTMISRIIEKGLLRAGRVTKLRILMQDRPGQLEMASRIIAAEGANVIWISATLFWKSRWKRRIANMRRGSSMRCARAASRFRKRGRAELCLTLFKKTEPFASLIALQSGSGKAFLYIKRSCQA